MIALVKTWQSQAILRSADPRTKRAAVPSRLQHARMESHGGSLSHGVFLTAACQASLATRPRLGTCVKWHHQFDMHEADMPQKHTVISAEHRAKCDGCLCQHAHVRRSCSEDTGSSCRSLVAGARGPSTLRDPSLKGHGKKPQ